jgi:hypothetical protein
VEPFPKRAEDAAALVGDLSVSDVWGPANTEGPARERYFYSFTDAKSEYSVIYFSHTKDSVLDRFKEYAALVETQTGHQLKRLRSDGGGEYINAPFRAFCAEKGIIMESTAPYSPAQNGIAERLNRTLLEHARAMIFAKQAPKTLWPEAVAYACYIKNRTPTRALGMDTTPFQAFFGKKPNIGRLEEFGKKCWIQVPDQRRTKLEPKSEQHIFTGVAANAKAWRYYNVHTRHIQTSRNIIFDEIDNTLHPAPEDVDSDDLVAVPRTPAGAVQPPVSATAAVPENDAATVPVAAAPKIDARRSTRLASKPVPDYRHMHEGERALSATEIVTEPMSYAEALRRNDYPIWKEAMEIEMAQHAEVGTWELVELPAGKNVVGSRWVYAAKTDEKGKFDLASARTPSDASQLHTAEQSIHFITNSTRYYKSED